MDSARRQTVMRLMCGVFFEVGLNPDLRKSTLQLVLKFLITFAAMLSEWAKHPDKSGLSRYKLLSFKLQNATINFMNYFV